MGLGNKLLRRGRFVHLRRSEPSQDNHARGWLVRLDLLHNQLRHRNGRARKVAQSLFRWSWTRDLSGRKSRGIELHHRVFTTASRASPAPPIPNPARAPTPMTLTARLQRAPMLAASSQHIHTTPRNVSRRRRIPTAARPAPTFTTINLPGRESACPTESAD